VTAVSPGVDDAEGFGTPTLGQPVLDGDALPPFSNPLLGAFGVGQLGAVAHERVDLPFDVGGDVDGGVLTGSEHQPHLVDRPVLELSARLPLERKRIPGSWVHGTHRGLGGCGVIGMRTVGRLEIPDRVLGDDHLRPDLTDHLRDVVAKLQVGDDLAIHVTEEHEVGHSDLGCRLGLFLTPDRRHLITGHRVVEPSGLTVGDQAVGDLHPGIGEVGDRSGRAEVDVVGVGHDHQGTLDLGGRKHGAKDRASGRNGLTGRPTRSTTASPPTVATMTALDDLQPVPLDEIDLSDMEFWVGPRDRREAVFKTLRDTPELQHFEERVIEGAPFPPGAGYYALTRHDDIWQASRNPQLFCSGQGSNIGDLPQEMNEFFGSMINMDDPKHYRLRSIVSKGFTPKEINRVEEYIVDKAKVIVDRLIENFPDQTCDFVEHIGAALPLEIICDMMGIPADDYAQIYSWTNTILGVGDPDFVTSYDDLMTESLAMFTYAQELGQSRRDNPQDDITSVMMNAEVDGEQLTAQEFGSFFILLVVAGNETTRNALTHGMKALTDHPDQRDLWWSDYDTHAKTAVEEIVRWASPVIHFRRTATADTEIAGQPIKAGEKVVMFYGSGNRDERVFDDPHRFDVTRPTQPAQVGFGAGGPHFCLGANLARRELIVMFDEIRRRLPNMRTVGEPSYLQSNFINGIKRLECRWD